MKKIDVRKITGSLASVLVLGSLLVACQSNPTAVDEAGTAVTVSSTDAAAKLASDLGMSSTQTDSVKDAFRRHGIISPDSLWKLAVELQTILTPEQKALLFAHQEHSDSLHAESLADSTRPPHREGSGRGRGHDGPPAVRDSAAELAAMVDALKLTDAQKAALIQLFDQERSAMEALRTQIDSGTIDREAARAAMEKIRQDRDAALAMILDATQLEIFKIHDAIMHRLGRPGGHGKHR